MRIQRQRSSLIYLGIFSYIKLSSSSVRAGVLGYLEEVRDDIVLKLTRFLQGACYGYLGRKEYQRRKKEGEKSDEEILE